MAQVCAVFLVIVSATVAMAQNDNTPPPSDNTPPAATIPSPAQSPDNPPLSSLDVPVLGSSVPARSFLDFGVHVSESVDSNAQESPTNSAVIGETHALGSVMFQKFSGRTMTAFDYIGGIVFYPAYSTSINQIHQFDGEERISWKKGQFTVRDQFSYLPEGSFGFGAYGDSAAYNLGLGNIGYAGDAVGAGLGGIFNLGEFGSLEQQPRIDNLTIAEVDQSLSARSALTVAGGYGLVHFTNNSAGFIDSDQITGQVGYDYLLTRKTQIGVLYGYQEFHYPDIPGSSFSTHIANFLYGHRISGRMDFSVAAGPQITVINNSLLFGGSSERVTVSGRAALRYAFPRTSLGLYYDRYNTAGSGYFLGATSDIVRFSVSRPLTRRWTATSDIGYSHNNQVVPGAVFGLLPPSTHTFQYVYAGAAVRRSIGQHLSVFVSYQFDDLWFNNSTCVSISACTTMAQRHVATIGLDWHPHPIRLD